jgi:hypothetical protein
MKKLLAAIFIMMSGVALNAQDTAAIQQPPILPPYSGQEINREKIEIHELPEAVAEALKMNDYAGWTIDAAYKALMTDPQSPESEGEVVYIVDLKRKGEGTSIRFDKDGVRLDDDSGQ